MGMLSEFKTFAMKGNVIDLAIGVVIGAAFGKILSSLIEDVITPLLLKPALEAAKLSEIEELVAFGGVKYGMFLSSLINFVIVAFVLFLIIKGINTYKKKHEVVENAPQKGLTQEELLAEIRDLLKK
ncbi:MAG: large conductance mechanosensitive channel protein MscL [Chitinophagaceae bacterium]|nr:large conductance mechanosensitive channel protein MscL [Chitinophagaceae bacterium]